MKASQRFEILGLGILTVTMMALMVSGQSTSAASAVPGGDCTVSFRGTLTSLHMSPEGAWSITSDGCSVTRQSGGVTTGSFTGRFGSGVFNGTVSGTWSVSGSIEKVVASNAEFTLSFSTNQGVDQTPLLGSSFQGTLSGTGSPLMLTVGTVGQITIA